MASPNQVNPYVGPVPFSEEDRDRLYGRFREARDLPALVIANRVLLVYGESGTGKTSLLNAALIPQLRDKQYQLLPIARVRGLIPSTIPYDKITNPFVLNTLISWSSENINPSENIDLTYLLDKTIPQFLAELPSEKDKYDTDLPRVAIFDQFEELFSFYPEYWKERQPFFEQIRDALNQNPLLHIVLIMREDYIAQLDPYASLLPDKLRNRFRLSRMSREAALEAIRKPMENTGRSFAKDVAEQLVDELLTIKVETPDGKTTQVVGEYVEPVQLQVVCRSLWDRVPPTVKEITPDYLHAGEVDSALSQLYEASIPAVVHQTKVKEEDLRNWFDTQLITATGTRSMIHQDQTTTGGIPNDAVKFLEDQHLIRAEVRAGGRWYELTHDRMIDPIRHSNEAWQQQRNRRTRRINIQRAAFVVIILIILAGGVLLSSISDATNKSNLASTQVALVATTSYQSQLQGASSALAIGNTDLAIALALQLIQADPTSIPARGLLANAAYTPGTQKFLPASSPVNAVAYSPDGLSALAGSENGTLTIWDLTTGLSRSPLSSTAGEAIKSVAISRDGKYALSGGCREQVESTTSNTAPTCNSGEVLLWDLSNLQSIPAPTSIGKYASIVTSVAFSPDGRTALAGSADGTLILWNLSNQQQIRPFTESTSAVNTVAFSPDGKTILVGSADGSLIFWDVATAQSVFIFDMHGAVNSVAFSPDGKFALAGLADKRVLLINAISGNLLRTLSGHTGAVNSVAFSPDGRFALSGSTDNTLILWDLTTGQLSHTFIGHSDTVNSVAFSPDGRSALSGSKDQSIRVWDLFATQETVFNQFNAAVNSVVFSPDGQTIFSASADQTLSAWDAQTGGLIRNFVGEEEPITALAVSADGRYLVSGGNHGTLYLWDVASGSLIRRFFRQLETITSVAFSPDGSRIVSASQDTSVYIWDTATAQLLVRSGGDPYAADEPTFAVFNPDGRYVAYGKPIDLLIHVIDAQTGAEVRQFGVENWTGGLAFSPDGRSIVGGLYANAIGLWDVDTGEQKTFAVTDFGTNNVSADQYNQTLTVAVSPDGKYMVSGTQSGTVSLWDAASSTEIYEFKDLPGAVNSVAFSPDGTHILSGSSDATMRLWSILPLNDLIAWTYAHRYVRALTCTERQAYSVQPSCNVDGSLSATASPTVSTLAPTSTLATTRVTPNWTALPGQTASPGPSPIPSATLTPTPIPVGQQVAVQGQNRGYIPVGGREDWTYQGHQGEILTIRVNAYQPANRANDSVRIATGLFDPLLTVRDSGGTILDQQDDLYPAIDTDSVIDSLTLPADGTYQIEVSTYDGKTGGGYFLTILPAPTPVKLTAGQTVSGVVTAVGDYNLWTFDGTAGSQISLSAVPYNSDLGLILQLRGARGQMVQETDVTGLAALINSYRLPETGTYTALVRRVTTDSSSAYAMTFVDLAQTTPTPMPTPTAYVTPQLRSREQILFGAAVYGTIDANTADQWTFDGTAGQTLSITMKADPSEPSFIIPLLNVVDPEGYFVVSSVDGETGTFPISENGTYIVIASSASGTSGAYTLEIDEVQVPTAIPYVEPTAGHVGTMTVGQTVTGHLDYEGFDEWTFDGTAGQPITISMAFTDPTTYLLPYLVVLLPDGTTQSIVAGDNNIAELPFTGLPLTGSYTIDARSYYQDAGDYSVSVVDLSQTTATPVPTLAPLPPLPTDPPTQPYAAPPTPTSTPEPHTQGTVAVDAATGGSVSTAGEQDRWAFSGTAGDHIEIIVSRGAGSALMPQVALYTQDGTLLVRGKTGAGPNPEVITAQIDNFIVPQTGTYFIVVSDAGQQVGLYNLTVRDLSDSQVQAASAAATPEAASASS